MMFAETQHTDLENKKVSASRVESGKWLKEVISEQQIKLRCAGGAELKFVFAHLVEEFVFTRENPAEWNIVPSSIDAREKTGFYVVKKRQSSNCLNQSHSSGKNWVFRRS